MGFGSVVLEKTIVAPDERRFDLHFIPHPVGTQDSTVAPHMNLVRRMASQECVMELFAATPTVDVLRDCTSKHLDHHRNNRRAARKNKAPRPMLTRLWIITPGRPQAAMRRFVFRPAPSWPPGFYRSGSALRLWLVVLSELLPGRDTLLLRLLGSVRSRLAAAREIHDLPTADPIRRPLLRVLSHVRFVLERDPTAGTPEERELMSNLLAEFERYEADIFHRGVQQGEARGKAASILSILAARGLPISDEVRSHILSCDNLATLDSWLARALTTPTADSLFPAN